MLSVLVPLMTGLALYALTRRALRRHDIALGALIAYGLLGNWGSLDYTRWGGLPNALGFALFLVFLLIFFAPGFAYYRIVAGGIVLGSIPLAHNHVMLTAGLILVAYAGFLILRDSRVTRYISKTAEVARAFPRRELRRLLLTGLVALVASGLYVIPLLLRFGQLQDTSVLRVVDKVDSLPFEDNGWVLWGLALLGAAIVYGVYVPVAGYRQARGVGRGGARESRAFLVIALATLAAAFCLCYYAYSAYALRVYGYPFTAFTPSRFLTDMTYFLAIYAGVALAALWQIGTRHAATVAANAALPLPEKPISLRRLRIYWPFFTRSILAIVVLVTASVTIWPQVLVGNRVLPGRLAPGESEAFAWIRMHTPRSAFVVNLDPNAPWAPYFTRREVANTPIPTDEFVRGYVSEKRFLVSVLLGVVRNPGVQVLGVASTDTALRSLLGRPVIILTPQAMTSELGPPAYSSAPEQVYLQPGGFSRLQSAVVSTGYSTVTQWWTDTNQAPPPNWSSQAAATLHWRDTGSGNAPALGVRFARIVVRGILPRHAMVSCRGEDGAMLFVDGKVLVRRCNGRWVPLPALSVHTPHVIGFQIVQGQDQQPWGDFFLLAG